MSEIVSGEISTSVYSHVLLTIKGGKYPITEGQAKFLRDCDDMSKAIILHGCQIQMHQIAEVVTSEEFNQRAPVKQHNNIPEFVPPPPNTVDRKEMFVKIRKGFLESGKSASPFGQTILRRLNQAIDEPA